jgi:3,4-dihydroxy-2-butanone 4-phosphate synthase
MFVALAACSRTHAPEERYVRRMGRTEISALRRSATIRVFHAETKSTFGPFGQFRPPGEVGFEHGCEGLLFEE